MYANSKLKGVTNWDVIKIAIYSANWIRSMQLKFRFNWLIFNWSCNEFCILAKYADYTVAVWIQSMQNDNQHTYTKVPLILFWNGGIVVFSHLNSLFFTNGFFVNHLIQVNSSLYIVHLMQQTHFHKNIWKHSNKATDVEIVEIIIKMKPIHFGFVSHLIQWWIFFYCFCKMKSHQMEDCTRNR